MNYLAHLHLSEPDAESMVGNLMGDFRKYLDKELLPEKVSQGISNHLQVDKFTDSSPIINDLKSLFSKDRRRFAGIIIDVVFDYYLIQHWQGFSDEELNSFIDRVHRNLSLKRNIMPARMQHVMSFMIGEDWLRSYSSLTGIDSALNRISTRIRFENKMAGAIEEIEANYEQLEQGFLGFFPELVKHIENS